MRNKQAFNDKHWFLIAASVGWQGWLCFQLQVCEWAEAAQLHLALIFLGSRWYPGQVVLMVEGRNKWCDLRPSHETHTFTLSTSTSQRSHMAKLNMKILPRRWRWGRSEHFLKNTLFFHGGRARIQIRVFLGTVSSAFPSYHAFSLRRKESLGPGS